MAHLVREAADQTSLLVVAVVEPVRLSGCQVLPLGQQKPSRLLRQQPGLVLKQMGWLATLRHLELWLRHTAAKHRSSCHLLLRAGAAQVCTRVESLAEHQPQGSITTSAAAYRVRRLPRLETAFMAAVPVDLAKTTLAAAKAGDRITAQEAGAVHTAAVQVQVESLHLLVRGVLAGLGRQTALMAQHQAVVAALRHRAPKPVMGHVANYASGGSSNGTLCNHRRRARH